MKKFLSSPVFVFDIDNTLLDWSNPLVFLRSVPFTLTLAKQKPQLDRLRGFRCSIDLPYPDGPSTFTIPTWLSPLFSHLVATHQRIAIFSDLPHYEMHPLFLEYGITTIISAKDIQALKPLPDGLWQICSALQCGCNQLVVIGDQRETDGLAAFRAGACYYPIQAIQYFGWERFLHSIPQSFTI